MHLRLLAFHGRYSGLNRLSRHVFKSIMTDEVFESTQVSPNGSQLR